MTREASGATWRPIEELAEGVDVILYQPEVGMVIGSIARHFDEYQECAYFTVEPKNVFSDGDRVLSEVRAPTHWMSLPEPPKTEDSA